MKKEEKKEEAKTESKKPSTRKTSTTSKAPAKEAKVEEVKSEEVKVEETATETEETAEPAAKKGYTPHNYRVVYDKEAKIWRLKKDGAKRVIKNFDTKAEALEYAKRISEKNEMGLTVHKKDGKFQKKK